MEPRACNRWQAPRHLAGAAYSTAPAGCQLRQRRIPRPSRRRSPEAPAPTGQSPQRQCRKTLLTAGIPAHPRLDRKRQDRPVTPEVAGSSPVAPAENVLQIAMFCCQDRRERPPAFRAPRCDPARRGNAVVAGNFVLSIPLYPGSIPRENLLGRHKRALRYFPAAPARGDGGRLTRYYGPSSRARRNASSRSARFAAKPPVVTASACAAPARAALPRGADRSGGVSFVIALVGRDGCAR
jgi:hypothetical protein